MGFAAGILLSLYLQYVFNVRSGVSFQEKALLDAGKIDFGCCWPTMPARRAPAAHCPKSTGGPLRKAAPALAEEPFALHAVSPMRGPPIYIHWTPKPSNYWEF